MSIDNNFIKKYNQQSSSRLCYYNNLPWLQQLQCVEILLQEFMFFLVAPETLSDMHTYTTEQQSTTMVQACIV